jgi:hypothetical protein
MSKQLITGSIVTLLAALAPLYAQNGPGDFMAERVLTLSSAVAPNPPNFPDAVLTALQNGVIELHQRFTYNSAQRTIEQLAFVVPANTPVPVPDPSGAPVGDHYIIQVDSAMISNSSHPSLVLTGHVTLNDVVTPFGDVTGAGVTLTIGYSGAGAAVQFGPILESVSPLYGLYSTSGAGSLSLTPSSQTCSQGTLNGVYMFQLGGSVQASTGWAPYSESGSFHADGKGNIAVLDSGNIAGSVFTGRTFPIAYAVNDDCTATFTFGSSAMDVQVSRDGKSVDMVFTKPSSVIANGVGRSQ